MDYFAVSLPDFLVFDEDLQRRNRIHCHYMMALGLLGLGEAGRSRTAFRAGAGDEHQPPGRRRPPGMQPEGWHLTTTGPHPDLPTRGYYVWIFPANGNSHSTHATRVSRRGGFKADLEQSIRLPGSLQAQGFGDEITLITPWTGDIIDRSFFDDPRYEKYRQPGKIKVPFWLQPETYYLGPAWYQREIEIPADWAGKRVSLFLERAHWETRVWVDGAYAEANISLSVPHVYELSACLTPGKHRLALRVDNRRVVNVGPNAHSISDHTQTNWNGVVGRIELRAGSPVWVENAQVYPQVASRSARVVVRLRSQLERPVSGTLTLQAQAVNLPGEGTLPPVRQEVGIPAGGEVEISLDYPLGAAAQLWDEFNPALYRLDASLAAGGFTDGYSTRFGLREIKPAGTQLALNGRPIFIRGTLESGDFPADRLPAHRYRQPGSASSGLPRRTASTNCAFTPGARPRRPSTPQTRKVSTFRWRLPRWANQGAEIGEGDPLDQWLYEEAQRIIDAYGNHPSWIMMAYGNEPAGNLTEFLGKWVTYWKEHEPRRAHTSGAGWPALEENDYHNVPEPRVQAWGQELNSRINALPPETMTDYREYVARMNKPVVSHEIGQWCVFPNFAEMPKYTRAPQAEEYGNFPRFARSQPHGRPGPRFPDGLGQAAGAVLQGRYRIGAAHARASAVSTCSTCTTSPARAPRWWACWMPSGTRKAISAPRNTAASAATTVPLARLPRRYYQVGDTLEAAIDLAHYGPRDLEAAEAVWRLTGADGETQTAGRLAAQKAPTGSLTRLGEVRIPLDGLTAPTRYRLVVGIEGTAYENDWDIWVYPQPSRADRGRARAHRPAAWTGMPWRTCGQAASCCCWLTQRG